MPQLTVVNDKVNPFMVNIAYSRLSAVQCFSKDRYISSDSIRYEDGVALPKNESFEGADLTHSFTFDRESKCSLYQSDTTSAIIYQLDGNGKTMFLYVQCNLKKDSDVIKITFEDYSKFSGFTSTKTFYSAINQLMGGGVIQRKKANSFWVNPMVMFNGNRLEKYPNNVDIVAKVKIK